MAFILPLCVLVCPLMPGVTGSDTSKAWQKSETELTPAFRTKTKGQKHIALLNVALKKRISSKIRAFCLVLSAKKRSFEPFLLFLIPHPKPVTSPVWSHIPSLLQALFDPTSQVCYKPFLSHIPSLLQALLPFRTRGWWYAARWLSEPEASLLPPGFSLSLDWLLTLNNWGAGEVVVDELAPGHHHVADVRHLVVRGGYVGGDETRIRQWVAPAVCGAW